MNLFGQKTSVWIGYQSDDYEKMVNENSAMYSNWLPVEVMRVSISRGFKGSGKLVYPQKS